MGLSRLTLNKPIIGAVCGHAVAGGLEMSLCCDMIVSHDDCTFGVFCRRFGVPLMDGGTVRLAKVIGASRARDMVLTGRGVSGKEAHQWGLVNRLVKDRKDVMLEAIELARSIYVHPEQCMLGDKQSLFDVVYPNFNTDFRNEFQYGIYTLQTGETLTGAKNFAINKQGRHG